MKRLLILIVCFSFLQTLSAQSDAKFTVEVSSDSILFGNYFQVKFTLENARGTDFSAPVFEGFNLISGPNYASSFQMINGEVSQSVSYSFYLEPKDIGNFYLQPAVIRVGDQVLETQPLEVMVVPNPDGVIQRPQQNRIREFHFDWGGKPMPAVPDQPEEKPAAPKKKRKTYKI